MTDIVTEKERWDNRDFVFKKDSFRQEKRINHKLEMMPFLKRYASGMTYKDRDHTPKK